ncbi:ribbon-helix-helix domain-containing protein [Bosea sp. NBC_00550]|uniref:ribbon-helix-helix domain-containing protein n=1 Tax=Bosea sp. NBC_00550 TaxID=2969621 RepID=UPI00222E6F36|nr:ribbon-helix-helix domain-containing protein [Bosea sp. NBC_00550]UZF95728.1 ribbon-helix-helix domain-containing protein [Bosea sp. NBC_00550]
MDPNTEDIDIPVAKGPRLRLLTVQGRRRAFKLEDAFWQALEYIARRRKQRLSAYVAQLIGNDSGNATARLRVAAIEWFMREAQAEQPAHAKERWQRIIDLMAEPAFVIDRHKQIRLFNSSMRNFVASVGAQSHLRFELAAEISRVLMLFDENEQRILSIPCSLEAGQQSWKATVRVTLLERAHGHALLLCVLHPSSSSRPSQSTR